MKLELKHLAPYLPYELKGNYEVSEVVPSAKFELRNKELRTDNIDFFLNYAKPILRPLSDLTKEIEVNGEKFVPYKWLKENYLTYGGKYGFNWFRNKTNLVNIKILPYDIIEKLLEWHFDLFNLIDAGLAIDINTI